MKIAAPGSAVRAVARAVAVLCAALAGVTPARAAAPMVQVHGQAWSEFGGIAHSTDTLLLNLNDNRMQGMSAQFTLTADIGDRLQAAVGLGGTQVYHGVGDRNTEINMLGTFRNYITEARLTWHPLGRDRTLSLTVGNFAYTYNPDVRNLGLYLLRGPVYPGFLISGFGNVHTDSSRANIAGVRLHHGVGNFRQDLILSQEREVAPSLDWSLAYVAKVRATQALEVGAGANFYHLLPNYPALTRLRRSEFPNLYNSDLALQDSGSPPYHPYDLQYIEVVAPGDTVFYTHQGLKLMAMFTLDIQRLTGPVPGLGPSDLRLYGEAAVIGVKDYGTVYDNVFERIPVMLGFNLPTWGWLDVLALEVEWYGAKYRADYSKLGLFNSPYHRNINPTNPTGAAPLPSPIPVSYLNYADAGVDENGIRYSDSANVANVADLFDMTSDDWKWSVYAQRTFAGRFRFIAQVANDHYVPRPSRLSSVYEKGGLSEALSSPRDWYFMLRAGYLF